MPIKTQIKFIDTTTEIMHLDLETISYREKKIKGEYKR